MCIMTDHGEQRIKERVGKKVPLGIAASALRDGISHSETSGKLRKYMDKLYLTARKANNSRIYNRNVYLFHDDVLITVLNLPSQFHKVEDKIKLRRKDND